MSISRTATGGYLTDDGGTGTTGTILNNSERQSMLDLIDARWTVQTITLTGSQNNVSITSSGVEADVVLLNNASDITITGIAAPASPAKPGKRLTLISIGAGNVALKHQNTGSTAANRLINLATSADSSLLAAKGVADYVYDPVASRWRMERHDQGGWIAATYAGGNFTGNGSMTWTVDSGDLASGYWLRGNQMMYYFLIISSSVGGTVNTSLRIGSNEWGGFTHWTTGIYWRISTAIDNGTSADNVYCSPASTTLLGIQKVSGNWTLSTNNTSITASIGFMVT